MRAGQFSPILFYCPANSIIRFFLISYSYILLIVIICLKHHNIIADYSVNHHHHHRHFLIIFIINEYHKYVLFRFDTRSMFLAHNLMNKQFHIFTLHSIIKLIDSLYLWFALANNVQFHSLKRLKNCFDGKNLPSTTDFFPALALRCKFYCYCHFFFFLSSFQLFLSIQCHPLAR